MRVRKKDRHHVTGHSSTLNTHGLGEMIVYYDSGDASSEYLKDYEFRLSNGEWVPFNDPRIETDKYNTSFYEREEKVDPNQLWQEIVEIAAEANNGFPESQDQEGLAERILDMDNWFRNGGFAPYSEKRSSK